MDNIDFTKQLKNTIDELSSEKSLEGLFHEHKDGDPLPSARDLEEIVKLIRSILLPGFFWQFYSSFTYSTISDRSRC